jgi:virginiamycin B lyase
LPALALLPHAASSRPSAQVTRVIPRFSAAIPHVTHVRPAIRGQIAEYTVPSPHTGPAGMTAGLDGHLWFVENFGNRLGEFDARTGTFTEYPIPSRNSSPVRITADAYGNLWFTEANTNKIGEFTIATHAFAEYAIPTANSSPYDITTKSSDIWFTEQSGNNVGNLSHGTITEYKVPTKNSDPVGMASGATK